MLTTLCIKLYIIIYTALFLTFWVWMLLVWGFALFPLTGEGVCKNWPSWLQTLVTSGYKRIFIRVTQEITSRTWGGDTFFSSAFSQPVWWWWYHHTMHPPPFFYTHALTSCWQWLHTTSLAVYICTFIHFMNYNLVPFCLLLQTCATMMNMYPLIKKGADYNNCKETLVLFLTEPFDESMNVYTLSFHNLCAQSDYSSLL